MSENESIELTEKLLMKIAGWEAMKHARALVSARNVRSSSWKPPILKGMVEAGPTYRCGLVIKSDIDVENLCSCRQSRQWGTICAHSVAVGLHYLRRQQFKAAQAAESAQAVHAAQAAPISKSHPAPSRIPTSSPVKPPVSRLKRAEDGELLQLHVILPPNLSQSLAGDKVMLYFQGEDSLGRKPLDAFPKNETYRFSLQDERVLDRIEDLAQNQTPGMLRVSLAQFASLLDDLIGHPRITLGKSQQVEVSDQPFALPIRATLADSGEIDLRIRSDVPIPQLVTGPRLWAFSESRFQPLELSPACGALLQGEVRLARKDVPQFLMSDWPVLETAGSVEANFQLSDFVLEPQPPRFLLALEGGMAQLRAHLQCAYGKRILTAGLADPDENLWLPDPENPTRYSTRDLAAERAALDRLKRYGFLGPAANGQMKLAGQDHVLNFFAREYWRLEREWEVTLEARLENSMDKNLERIEPEIRAAPSGEQWFDLNIDFSSADGHRLSHAEVQRLILSSQSHQRLSNGKFAIIDTGAVEELQEVLLDCAPEQHSNGYHVQNRQLSFIEATLADSGIGQLKAPTEWKEKVAGRQGRMEFQLPPLGELEKILRPYQKDGVGWLSFLRNNGFGGILADEMGLGKTLQTLAHLLAAKSNRTGEPALPSLVVCPTSLVFNWVEEAKKFAPDLKVLPLHGADRANRFEHIPEYDLIVTSYALIRRDAERYAGLEFDTIILDEAQHIKNRQTQNARAVKAVRSRHRFVLTGTPLENSVLDLWSIFDFLMPGYLGTDKDFKERYEVPITRDQDPAAQARLARRLKPFLLRRLKSEVAKDLPEKMEQVSFCELTETQAAVYKELLESSRAEVFGAVDQQGIARSRMIIFKALLRLRQTCCDLRLLKLDHVETGQSSGKLDLFEELLEEIIDGGHRVLIFSQFVEMLKLLEEKLEKENLPYCYLDGSTKNRGEAVHRFQNDSSVPVFLISLKAGGVGLNLTGADTVIHFDPWWNPAVEDQATGRAHRIGQTRVVTSYKLIARGTIEEKILKLQERKKEIIDATLGDESHALESLSWDEIQELFAD